MNKLTVEEVEKLYHEEYKSPHDLDDILKQLADTMRENERMRYALRLVFEKNVYSNTRIREAVADALQPNKEPENAG